VSVKHNHTGTNHFRLNGTNKNATCETYEIFSHVGKASVKLASFDNLPMANGFFQTLRAERCVEMTVNALGTHKAGLLARNKNKMKEMAISIQKTVKHGQQVLAEDMRVLKINYNGPTVVTEMKRRKVQGYASEAYSNMISGTVAFKP
jgi:hypothetical protein